VPRMKKRRHCVSNRRLRTRIQETRETARMRHTRRQLLTPTERSPLPPRSHSLHTAVAHVEAGSAIHLQIERALTCVGPTHRGSSSSHSNFRCVSDLCSFCAVQESGGRFCRRSNRLMPGAFGIVDHNVSRVSRVKPAENELWNR